MEASPGTSPLAARLFEQHGPSIYRYFRRLTSDRAVAEDLFQEVFRRVVRHAGTYEPRERERAWIFRIARNVLIDHNRTGRHTPAGSARFEPVASASQGVQSDLRLALAALGADDCEAFLLAEVGGLTYVEIAAATETTVPAVRSRIYRARLALRNILPPPAPLTRSAASMREDDE